MPNWIEFEEGCLSYLQSKYASKAKFTAMGKWDSTKPDISVETKNKQFYIEVKQENAQSGQFVLLPNNKEFVFSPRNKTVENEFTVMITKYMNDDFERYNMAGTAGQSLDIDKNVFYSWIVDYYKSKGVAYFMTKSSSNDRYIILPVNKFENYFDVSAKYRIKRSGSSQPSVKYRTEIISILENDFGITQHLLTDKKMFVLTHKEVNKIRFNMGNYEYYLTEKGTGKYEVRQLSNTYNMNVIFSISLKNNQNIEDLIIFEKELE